jgi:dTDP-6-deoxy-L-talose 4-dehydrogenase (NAD+)
MTNSPKILVTGATGFIGTNLIPLLLDQGYQVVASSRDPVKARKQAWFKQVQYQPWTIENIHPDRNLFEYFNKPDYLIHLAWDGLPNYGALLHTESNSMANYFFCKNLLEHGLNDLTVAGTCMEYGKANGELTEDMPAHPENAYAIGKVNLYNNLLALQKHKPFHLKWLRLFYMFGEGQHPNSLYSQLIQAIIEGKEVFDMSKGDQIRDFLPISDMAGFIVSASLQKEVTGIINICSNQPISVKAFAEKIIRENKSSILLNTGAFPYSAHEAMYFWGSNSKLSKLLNNE